VAKTRWLQVVLLGLVGLIWLGQGIGLIRGSFMTGQAFWAVAGGILLAGALVVAVNGRRR
jgi:hypothetical protein